MRKSIDYFLFEVRSLADLPSAVGAAICAAVPEAAVQGIVVIPPQEVLLSRKDWLRWLYRTHITPRRTVVFASEAVVVVEAVPGESLDTTIIPLARLLHIDLHVVLLSGTLRFTWAAADGAPPAVLSKAIIFNTVGERIIRKWINVLRAQLARCPDPAAGAAAPPQNGLSTLPLKFYNYLHLSLLPGESACPVAYQPVIRQWQRGFPVCLSPNRLITLTDHFLIVLEEERATLKPQYGIIMTWYPRWIIRQAHFEPTEDADWGWFTLAIGDAGKALTLPLDAAHAVLLQEALGAAAPARAVETV